TSDAIEKLPAYTESIDRIKDIEREDPLENSGTEKSELLYHKATLDMQAINFRYPNDIEDVLQNFSLQIPARKKVALLGRSGAGKSTLLKLIAGALSPNSGKIHINEQQATNVMLANHVSVLNQK